MNRNLYLIVLLTITMILYFGCATVTKTVYLQNIDVSGSLVQPPLNITNGNEKGTFTFSPKLILNTQKSVEGHVNGHTNVDIHGEYQVDIVNNSDGTWKYKESSNNIMPYYGNNFRWSTQDVTAGFQFDVAASNHIALNGALNYMTSNQHKLISGAFGVGLFYNLGSDAFRMDFGLLYQSYLYDISSVEVTTVTSYWGETDNTVVFFRDKEKSAGVDLYLRMTYNTRFKDLPVNFFVSLSYFGQTFSNYSPNITDTHYYPYSTSYVNNNESMGIAGTFIGFTPGIYKDINEWSRIILGLNLLKETQSEVLGKDLLLSPMLQIDFHL